MTPVVLITGALSGIGRATALAFAHSGARLIVSGRREELGKAFEAELRGLGADAVFVAADVRKESDIERMIEAAREKFGRLDVGVNSAGLEGALGPITEQTPETFAAAFETNVLGTLLALKHELRIMQPQGSGSIVNISSTMGSRGAPNASLYTASKHAVEGLTKSAALEAAAFGVRVNAVAPGPTDTDLLTRFAGNDARKTSLVSTVPLKRVAEPAEIADAILYLASDRSSYITGQILGVNGGRTAG